MQREREKGIRGGVAVALLVAARSDAAGAKTEAVAAEGRAVAVGTGRAGTTGAAHGIRRNTGATQHQPDTVHQNQHKTCLFFHPYCFCCL